MPGAERGLAKRNAIELTARFLESGAVIWSRSDRQMFGWVQCHRHVALCEKRLPMLGISIDTEAGLVVRLEDARVSLWCQTSTAQETRSLEENAAELAVNSLESGDDSRSRWMQHRASNVLSRGTTSTATDARSAPAENSANRSPEAVRITLNKCSSPCQTNHQRPRCLRDPTKKHRHRSPFPALATPAFVLGRFRSRGRVWSIHPEGRVDKTLVNRNLLLQFRFKSGAGSRRQRRNLIRANRTPAR